MEFCTAIAVEEILKNVKESNNRNIVISPVSLNLMLNLLASGSNGSTLEQLLGFLGFKNLSRISKKSLEIMKLFASNETSLVHDNEQLELPSMEDKNSEGKKRETDELFYGKKKRKRSRYFIEEIRDVGRSSEIINKGPELFCLNRILVDESVGPLGSSFKDLTQKIYKAKVRSVDFANQAEKASNIVNRWVKKGTKGLIKDPTTPKDFKLMTSMVLINALYFKGVWNLSFDPKLTKQKKFHLLNGETVDAFFMTTRRQEKYYYGSFNDFKLLKLPYLSANNTSSLKIQDEGSEKRFSMYIFLPRENNGLQELIKIVSSNPGTVLDEYFDNLKHTVMEELWIPKLKFSHNFRASEVMKQMGLKKPFEQCGEFSEMVDSAESHSLYLSDIIHRAVIEVNEEGTKAAAFTKAMFIGCSWPIKPPPPRPSFVADHPFIFVIREEFSGVLLFLGAVLNPLL